MFFVVMFLGGVYLPRVYLPDVLIRIGDFTPPGVQGLQDAWLGNVPQLLPLLGMAIITVVAGRDRRPDLPVGVTLVAERALARRRTVE